MKYVDFQKGIVPIILVFVLVLILVGVGGKSYFKQQQIEESSVLDETANWKTYQNEKYGFEMKYPPTATLYQHGDANIEQAGGFMPSCNFEATIACLDIIFPQYEHTNFEGATVSVDTSPYIYPEPKDPSRPTESECLAMNIDMSREEIKEVNGIKFIHGTWREAATGHTAEVEYYKTFSKNSCLEINLTIDNSRFEDDVFQKEFTDEDHRNVASLLNQIFSTFIFFK